MHERTCLRPASGKSGGNPISFGDQLLGRDLEVGERDSKGFEQHRERFHSANFRQATSRPNDALRREDLSKLARVAVVGIRQRNPSPYDFFIFVAHLALPDWINGVGGQAFFCSC
jgi:hypothetical protein